MIRLAVIVDTRLYRQGLCQLFEGDSRCEVAGEFSADESVVSAVGELGPDVILLDDRVSQGPSICRELRSSAPSARIVLLGVGHDLERVVEWAEAGVTGFVSDDEPVSELRTAIEVAARGDFACPRKLVGRLVGRLAASSGRRVALPLTARELQIVELLERGRSNKEIARALGIEVATAKNHVHNILEKLNVRRRSEAAAVVRRCIANDSVGAAMTG